MKYHPSVRPSVRPVRIESTLGRQAGGRQMNPDRLARRIFVSAFSSYRRGEKSKESEGGGERGISEEYRRNELASTHSIAAALLWEDSCGLKIEP